MYEYEITRVENVIIFIRDRGESYGGEQATRIDTEGKAGVTLYKHIKKHAGEAFAKAAKEQGFC